MPLSFCAVSVVCGGMGLPVTILGSVLLIVVTRRAGMKQRIRGVVIGQAQHAVQCLSSSSTCYGAKRIETHAGVPISTLRVVNGSVKFQGN